MWWPNRQASYDYPGVNFIHPLKQKAVEMLIETGKNYPTLRYIIVFGSSTQNRCTPFSDVDVMLSGVADKKFRVKDCDEVFDILHAEQTSRHEPIWKDILKDGVLVYDARTHNIS